VLRWVFEDEGDRAGALHLRDTVAAGIVRAIAPPTLLPEVAGVLVRAVRAGRLDPGTAEQALAGLERVGIEDPEPHDFAQASLRLALRTGMQLGDATYVEIARRLAAPLVSGDRQQLGAATAVGVAAIPLAQVPGAVW
jgi:predicted nucleic acid-binding protein